MARGWGRSEEDLAAEKEAAKDEERERGQPLGPSPEDAHRRARIHAIDLSLARIAEQLAKTSHADRRKALESARDELEKERKTFA